MNKVDFTQVLINYDGEPFDSTTLVCPHCGQPIDTDELTLRTVCLNALDFEVQGENIKSEEKFKRFQLAMRISQRDKIELTSSEIVLLKNQIAKRWRSWLMGQAWLLLEPPVEEE